MPAPTTHIRQQIREYVVALLADLPTTGKNVFEARVDPLQDKPAFSEVPGLCVYTKGGHSEPGRMGPSPRRMTRECELVIDVYVKKSSNPDDQLDQIQMEVEPKLGNDRTLGGLVKDCWLASDIDEDPDNAGDATSWKRPLIYHVEYETTDTAPNVALA